MAESAAGIQWKAPATWKVQPQRPMRAATYTVPPAAGDSEAGELAVFYFGPDQGGTVQANITRWEAQFPQKTSPPKTTKSTAAGLAVTTVEVAGTYAWSPSPMSPEKVMKPNFRMVGVIVQAPQGPVFFKFTAPAKTVAANQSAMQSMIQSIVKE